jgi:hypothetical protein
MTETPTEPVSRTLEVRGAILRTTYGATMSVLTRSCS